MPVILRAAGLLVLSNVFMTFAWYAHLKNLSGRPWYVAALVSWGIADSRAAISALLGGGISTVASLAMALVGFGKQAATDPQRAIRAFFVGETAKVGVVIVLFVVVLKTMKVVPLAMLGSYIATFFVFWVALANALPPLAGLRKES